MKKSKHNFDRILTIRACLGGALLAYATSLHAADVAKDPAAIAEAGAKADGGYDGFGEILVTARKQTESLMTVPVAVSAVGGKEIERKAVANLMQIAQLVPQVTLQQGNSGNGASFAIRGLGSSFLDSGLEQTVAININGMQIGRGHIIAQAFFDVAQVEVLKGPQALFFGKNSPAGVVSIKSVRPGKKLEGIVRAGYEFEADERYIEAAVGGPISDVLGARFAVRAGQSAGFLTNSAGPGVWVFSPGLVVPGQPIFQNPGNVGRQPSTKTLVGRGTFSFTPDNPFTALLTVQAGRVTTDGPTSLGQAVCFAPVTQPTAGGIPGATPGIPDPYGECRLDRNRVNGRLPEEVARNYPHARSGKPYSYSNVFLTTLETGYDFGDISLNAVTGYFHLKTFGFDLFENSSLSAVGGGNGETAETFSQEVRLSSDFDGPLNFTLGGYYEKSDFTGEVNVMVGLVGIGLFPDPRTGSYHSGTRISNNHNRTTSFFGQARYDLTDTLELAGGLRWTHETKRARSINRFVNQAFPLKDAFFIPENVPIDGRLKDNNVSPEVTVSWKATPDILVFGAYKTGYKSGGFANPQILTPAYNSTNIRFNPEKVKGFEGGVKGTLFDRTVQLQLTAYRYNYDNLQLSVFDPATASFLIKNAASARVQGVEGSIDWRPSDRLSVDAAVGYNHARYRSYTTAPCAVSLPGNCVGAFADLSGQPLARAPDWSGNIGATYDLPLMNDIRIAFNANMNFSSSFFSAESNEPLLRQKAFQRWNGSIRLHQENDRWELALIGRNLTDKVIAAYTTDTIGGSPTQFNVNTVRPREVTLQATIRF